MICARPWGRNVGQTVSCGSEQSWLIPKKQVAHEASEMAVGLVWSPDAFCNETATKVVAAVFSPHAVSWRDIHIIRMKIRFQCLLPRFYANWTIFFLADAAGRHRASLAGDTL